MVPLFRITALNGRHNIEEADGDGVGSAAAADGDGVGSAAAASHDYRLSGPVSNLGARASLRASSAGDSPQQPNGPASPRELMSSMHRHLPALPGGEELPLAPASLRALPALPGQLVASPDRALGNLRVPGEAERLAEERLVVEKKALLDTLMAGLESQAAAAVAAVMGESAAGGMSMGATEAAAAAAGGMSMEVRVELAEHFLGAATEAIQRVHRRASPGGGGGS